MKVHMCQCDHCGEVLQDTNPQVDAKLYEVSIDLQPLELIEDDKEGFMKACPNCKTDIYLKDL